MNKPFKTVSSQTVWACPWYSVRRDEIELPNGRAGEYFVIEKPDAVFVIPVTAEGRVILIRQYRQTMGAWCWEVPAGSLKAGQSFAAAAREELKEEIGGTAAELIFVGEGYPGNGICSEKCQIFIATEVTLGQTQREPLEFMEIREFSLAEVLGMVKGGEMADAMSAYAILLAAERLSGLC